ncbi:unnamed protein product [Boreogadus saida]
MFRHMARPGYHQLTEMNKRIPSRPSPCQALPPVQHAVHCLAPVRDGEEGPHLGCLKKQALGRLHSVSSLPCGAQRRPVDAPEFTLPTSEVSVTGCQPARGAAGTQQETGDGTYDTARDEVSVVPREREVRNEKEGGNTILLQLSGVNLVSDVDRIPSSLL